MHDLPLDGDFDRGAPNPTPDTCDDLDSHKIHVTFFTSQSATKKRTADLTLPELRDHILKTSGPTKLKLPWLKLATFGDQKSDKGCLRTDDNILDIRGIELDYDGLEMGFEEAIEIVKRMNVRTLIYTSPSYNAATLKWRLLMPLSKPESRAALMRPKYTARVNGFFKAQIDFNGDFFARESFTLSQAFLYGKADDNPDPNHQAVIIDGQFIDLRDKLLAYQDRGEKEKPNKNNGSGAHGFEAFLALVGDGDGLKGFRDPIRSAIASYAATHGVDLDREALKVILRDTINNAPKGKNRKVADIERYLSDEHLDDLIESAIKKYGLTAPKQRIARMLPWREVKPNGFPVPSMHNARLAITDLGIDCSHDTFHNKMLFGFKGEAFKHELGDEMSDHAVIRLRQIMSDRFCFDFTEHHTRDAILSLALEHCFDPVCDMLDHAEAAWDGTERLDLMAVDYFNCEDTPLNRAFVRKMMIGAAHRARVPGCKFDNILLLEGPEGWNKSSAFNVLAGDENFSDESILGARNREVQEQLATIWIHENADLAGMHKADIEHVKAFASRTTDIARAAYGHFVTKQKRHSIEVGTTNSEQYMQSQTGNRRFWPLKLLRSIDLEKLRSDRLQLWGEAAKCERAGESVTLDKALWDVAAVEQEKRRSRDAWEVVLADIPAIIYDDFRPNEEKQPKKIVIHFVDNQERVATLTLLEDVLRIPNAAQLKQNDTMRLRNAMKALGWEKSEDKMNIDGKRVHFYFRQWIDWAIWDRIRRDQKGGLSKDPADLP